MDRVIAGMVIVGNLSAAGKAVGKHPADSHFAGRVVVGSHLAGTVVVVVGGVADLHRVAYLIKVNSHHTRYCLYPGWGIGFVEWDRSAPGLDTDSSIRIPLFRLFC